MSVPCWHCGGPTEVVVRAGLAESRRCSVADCFSNFRGPGVASFLVGEQRKCDLKADAERLAELRRQFAEQSARPGATQLEWDLRVLIAVYEECAARGLTFGGGR